MGEVERNLKRPRRQVKGSGICKTPASASSHAKAYDVEERFVACSTSQLLTRNVGHYLGWVRRDVATAPAGGPAGAPADKFEDPDKQEW